MLRDLSGWLRLLDTDRSHRVVTGDPGSGKSSIIARLCLLADPERRDRIPDLDSLPADTRPPRGVRICPPIHARGKSADQLLAAIATASDTAASTPGKLLNRIDARRAPFIVPMDALDGANEPTVVATMIIRPLLEGTPGPLRLLLATRDHLLGQLELTPARHGD